MKAKHYILTGFILLATGFGLGRWAMPTPTPVVKYVSLPVVTGTAKPIDLKPISSNLATSIKFLPVYITDTAQVEYDRPEGTVQESIRIDTLASFRETVQDWNMERQYAGTLFDTPELGKLNWSGAVQYNTLTALDWEYSPVQRTETVVRPKRVIEPFVRISYNTFDHYTLGAGLFYKNVGLEVFYIRDVRADKKGVGGALSFKF